MYTELRKKWTCYICSVPAPDLSLKSLDIQERSAKTEIFVDGDYRFVTISIEVSSCTKKWFGQGHLFSSLLEKK